jgi:hypothetical protein
MKGKEATGRGGSCGAETGKRGCGQRGKKLRAEIDD